MNPISLKPGEVHTVKFFVKNESNEPTSGSATFNVSPSPFGIYLNKIGCFVLKNKRFNHLFKKETSFLHFDDPKVVDDNKNE